MGNSEKLKKVLLYTILAMGGLLMIIPFYWMFVLATQSSSAIYTFPPPLWFGNNTVQNYLNLINSMPFYSSLWNSTFVSVAQTALVILFCSMAGFAFAMYKFPGQKVLFGVLLATMMVPWMAGIIPWFMMMKWFGWIDSFKALIIPNIATAFGIYWMRQYAMNNVPPQLMDASRIDGCPEWSIFFRIIAPLLKPAMAALGIMTFTNTWNDFMAPLIILQSDNKLTLAVALNKLMGDPDRGFDAGALLMGTALAVLPLLIVFILAARKFMEGLTAGAIKE